MVGELGVVDVGASTVVDGPGAEVLGADELGSDGSVVAGVVVGGACVVGWSTVVAGATVVDEVDEVDEVDGVSAEPTAGAIARLSRIPAAKAAVLVRGVRNLLGCLGDRFDIGVSLSVGWTSPTPVKSGGPIDSLSPAAVGGRKSFTRRTACTWRCIHGR